MYIKTFTPGGTLMGVQEVNPVVWIKYQQENGMIVRCDEEEAHGILSCDDQGFFFKEGIMPRGQKETYYVEITKAEYDELKGGLLAENDPEDTEPEVTEETPEEEILTRAELTEKVTQLEQQNEFLTECLLEISEVIYA